MSSNWQDLVAAKQQENTEKIPPQWRLNAEQLALAQVRLIQADVPRRSGLLSDLELDLTENYTASQLLVKLATGQASSLDVTTAFCKRAAIAQQLVCWLLGNWRVFADTYRPPVSRRHFSLKP